MSKSWLRRRLPEVALFVIAALGCGVRLMLALTMARPPRTHFDEWDYLTLGHQWAIGHGLGTDASVTPGYPFFIGLVERLGDHLNSSAATSVGVSQAFLAGITIAVVGAIGWRLGSKAVGLVGATIFAVWPNLVLDTVPAMSETLATAAVAIVILVAVTIKRRWTGSVAPWWAILAFGVLVGLAAEVRPTLLPLGVLVLALPGSRPSSARVTAFLRVVGLCAAGALLVIIPCAVRASTAMNGLVLFDTKGGINACIGRAPGADGGPQQWSICPIPQGLGWLAQDRAATHEAIHLLLKHPFSEPRLMLSRLRYTLWAPDQNAVVDLDRGYRISQSTAKTVVAWSTPFARLVLIGAVAGTLLCRRGRLGGSVLPLALIALLAPPLLTVGIDRYRVPITPVLSLLAAASAVWLLGHVAALIHQGHTPASWHSLGEPTSGDTAEPVDNSARPINLDASAISPGSAAG